MHVYKTEVIKEDALYLKHFQYGDSLKKEQVTYLLTLCNVNSFTEIYFCQQPKGTDK